MMLKALVELFAHLPEWDAGEPLGPTKKAVHEGLHLRELPRLVGKQEDGMSLPSSTWGSQDCMLLTR